jgi:DNA-damage-inducible protein J
MNYIVMRKESEMAANALVQTRIDPAIKERAAAVLEDMGLSVSDAVRIMLTRTAHEGALPFDLAGDAHDLWFRAKVSEALAGLEAGTNALIDEAGWSDIAERKRGELKRLAATRRS